MSGAVIPHHFAQAETASRSFAKSLSSFCNLSAIRSNVFTLNDVMQQTRSNSNKTMHSENKREACNPHNGHPMRSLRNSIYIMYHCFDCHPHTHTSYKCCARHTMIASDARALFPPSAPQTSSHVARACRSAILAASHACACQHMFAASGIASAVLLTARSLQLINCLSRLPIPQTQPGEKRRTNLQPRNGRVAGATIRPTSF